MIRHSRYARSGTRRTSLAAGRRLGWVLVIVAAVLLPVVAWGTHVGAQGTETVCSAGLAVESGEICTYPGTTVEFSVDSSGGGRFLIFTSGSSIELKDADINGVIYNFVAKAQRDGTWLIETVGDSTAPTMTPTPTPTPTPGAGQVPPAPAAQRYEYSGSSIVLSWDASAGATSYTVYYDDFFGSDCRLGRSGSASFCEELATGLTGTSYTHASPDLDKNYYWLVACNSYGCSAIDSTNPVQLGGSPPAAPANQRYEYDGSSIVLTWDASTGADSYTVYYDDFFGSDCRLGRSGSASFCEELATGLTGTSYTHASPDLDKNYYWLVACNSYGCSEVDSTNPVQLGGSPPAAPANQRYEYDGSSIVLTWDASTGADSYTVYYDDFFGSTCRLGSSGPSFCEELATGLTGTSYTHASPDLDKNYYWLVACNSYGCSEVDSTNPVQLGGSPPAAPANQRYEYDGSSIVLTWDASAGADSYTVYYDDFFGSACRLGSSGPSFCEELATGLTGTSYTQTSPDLDKNYYWLVACNSYGCSAIDSTNPVQLGGSPPAAPANQRYEYDGSSIVLSWDASAGADSYTVYYDDFFGSACRLGSRGPSFCEELATGLTGTSYTHASPDAGRNYYWLVACNSYGCSEVDSTNPVQLGGSPPAAPANQRYEYDGSSIVLSWDASAGADSYTVYYDDFFGSACRLGSRGPSFCEELATGLTGASYTHASPDLDRNFYWLVACNSYGCSRIESSARAELVGSAPTTPSPTQVTTPDGETRGSGPANPVPDLVVGTPTVSSATPRAGTPFSLSATVRNQGTGSASSTILRYYRSSGPTITTADTAVGSEAVPGLSTSQSAHRSVSLIAPDTAGTYYYGACVDAVSGEADTTNNCSSAVTVTVGAAPALDAVVGTPAVSTATPDAGAPLTLSATVHNQGNGASGSTRLQFYRSSDSTITSADSGAGSDAVPGLSASESAGGELSLTAPAAPGMYYYGACVDVDTVLDEANAYNNCSSAVSVTVTPVEPPAPDLVVDAPTVSSASPPAGASFTLSATVRNQGDGSSSPTTLRYYYEASLLFSTIAETAVGSDPVSGLDASQNTAGSVSLTTPATPGRYDYWACVDVVTSESDATNNCSSAVEVRVAPDLVVEPPTVSDSAPAAGASITLSATVRNVGNGHSWPTTLRYYRSSNPTITTAGTALGSDSAPYLDAARSAGGSVSLAAPSTPGTYYYGACVDTDDTESDTTNNCSSAVAVTVAPDLVVDAPTVSESAEAAGANLTLSATVRNQGNSASGSTTLHFYRSGDSTITTADTAVGADLVSGLDPAEGTDGSVSLAEADPQDRYYYGACVDAVSGELDTTNNCSAAVALGPDLVVDTPTVGTSIPTVGEQFRIVVAVRNQGSTTPASTRSFVSFYRSTDSTITSSDERIHTSSTSALSPSETAYLYGDPRAPSTPGTYYYGACVSPTSGESNTANNCSPALEILVGRPDLVLDTLSVSPDSPETGSDFELRIDALHNHGNSWSGFTTLRYYLSADALVTSTDTELAYDLVGPMEPSSSYDIGTAGPFQAPSTPGTYYYGVCADAVLGEADTTNNCSVVAVTVRLPDLVMLLPTVSDSTPTAGAEFTFYATAVNRGGSRSQAASLVYYRSTDETITREDSWMGSDFVGGLEPHEVRHESVTLIAPSTAGTYYYGVCMRRGAAEYCTEAVEVTAGDAQPSPLVLRTECFVFQNQDFVRFTVTARVPLTSLAVSTYRVEGRTNTRHLVKRVEVGDLAAGSSYSRLTSRYFPAHLQRHLTTCTAGVEGYASVRPGFDPPAIMVPDPGPQTPADQPPAEQPPVEQTPIYPTYEATTQLWFDLHNASTVGALDYNTSCGVSQGVPCPWQDHISWWSSQPAHIQPCAFTTCDFSRD